MALNIKNEETCRLIDEYARLTGSSKTGAVRAAVQAALEAEAHRRGASERLAEALAITEQSAKLFAGRDPLPDHADLLYDVNGLPL